MMSEEIWFWVEQGERRGPSSSAKIKELLDEGTLTETTLVWRDGMPEWVPLNETELFGQEITPPVLPGARAPVLAKEPIPVRTAKLRTDYRPQLRSILGRSWTLLISDFWPFVGLCLLTSLILGVVMQFLFPLVFLMYPIITGYAFYVLLRIRGKKASIDELFIGFKKPFKDLALLNLVLSIPMVVLFVLFAVGIIVLVLITSSGTTEQQPMVFFGGFGIGMFLTIIVTTIVQVVGNFACLLIIDCGCSWRQALSLGWEATRRSLVKLVLVFLILGVLSFAGIIALYFGVFITSTWAWIAMVFLYEDAFGDESETRNN